jgi:hypothetical protein
MRRVCIALVCCLFVHIALPPSALAWWGWWDELSGPGKFWGFQFETRVFCFGDRQPVTASALALTAATQLEVANDNFLQAQRALQIDLPDELTAQPRRTFGADAQLIQLIGPLGDKVRTTFLQTVGQSAFYVSGFAEVRLQGASAATMPMTEAKATELATKTRNLAASLKSLAAVQGELQNELGTACQSANLQAACENQVAWALSAAKLSSSAQVLDAVTATYKDAAGAAEAAALATAFGGVTYSACPIEKDVNRRVSIDIAFRLMHTYTARSLDYAGGNQIKLATFVPSVSWRPLVGVGNGKIDLVDLAAGAGIYWLSSSGAQPGGFDAFSGMILEPLRIDFHAPSKLAESKKWWWTAVPSFRVGVAMFPAGFKAGAFGKTATPDESDRIPAEWIPNWAIFADISPIIYKFKH